MKVIILAAGLGSRLGKLTKKTHKSLLEISGETILGRLIGQFEFYGIKDINIICGHKKKQIDKLFPKYKTFFYPDYKKKNNLHTLYYFRKLLKGDCIISFADILLDKKIIKQLLISKKKITLCVDRSKSRPGTMKIDVIKNKLTYLGNFPKINNGNYIGIMKIRNRSLSFLIKTLKIIKDKSFNQYFTESFNHIIKNKITKVDYLNINKKFWMEIDDKKDLSLARKILNEKTN